MSTTYQASEAGRVFMIVQAVRETVATQVAAFERHMRMRRDRRRLNEMPDYLLADMGISRGEIDHMVSQGRRSRGLA